MTYTYPAESEMDAESVAKVHLISTLSRINTAHMISNCVKSVKYTAETEEFLQMAVDSTIFL